MRAQIRPFVIVLIPFLSGLFFQPRPCRSASGRLCLNPLSIGSVFPTYNEPQTSKVSGLNPLSIGSVFPTQKLNIAKNATVLIPFLSGLFFQPSIGIIFTDGYVLIPFLSGLFFQHLLTSN